VGVIYPCSLPHLVGQLLLLSANLMKQFKFVS